MKTYHLLQIDAFTTQPLQGNPCAVVFDADPLDAPTMQAIAREMNLSETAFVLKSDKADFRARYFTPAEEIPLAGHPTIATVYGLVETGRLKLTSDHQTISLELQAGVIPVEIVSETTRMETSDM
ncbi:MAG: PhzF family phenazine biosynthesis protein, partial [Anaerolineae bacterium]|nr:PhzF family phenazine biosynthesis protein [Anaerolineae bacterium]